MPDPRPHSWDHIPPGRIQDGLRCTTCGLKWRPYRAEPSGPCSGRRKDIPRRRAAEIRH